MDVQLGEELSESLRELKVRPLFISSHLSTRSDIDITNLLGDDVARRQSFPRSVREYATTRSC